MPDKASSTISPGSPVGTSLSRWFRSPLSFVTEALGATPEPWQVKALNAAAAKRERRHFREVPFADIITE